MTATVAITTARREDALRVPLRALRFRPEEAAASEAPDGDAPAAFVVGAGGALRRVTLRTGIRDEHFAEVLEGELAPGDSLAVAYPRTEESGAGGLPVPAAAAAMSPPSGPLLELRDVWRVFRTGDSEVLALQGVDLEVARGEFTAIMGSSGSGKSTLLHLLGCLDRPTRGVYRLAGSDVASLSGDARAALRNREIGFVFQSFNLIPRTSALENVELPLVYGGVSAAEQRERAREALREVGLEDREAHLPSQLSGGQQQRVAIARAIVTRPSLLLADEPTGNLDSRTSAEIIALFQRLNRERGATVLLVTHEPDVAAFAGRVVTFRDGRIVVGRLPGPCRRPRGGRVRLASMTLRTALRALRRNKLRSALTMLGVVIGVAAVIVMVSIGQGAAAAVEAQIRSLGTNLLIVLPGATTSGGVRSGWGGASTLTVRDGQAIAADSDAVAAVAWTKRDVAQAVNGERNWSTSLQGASASYAAGAPVAPRLGQLLQRARGRPASRVAVLGRTVADNLFGAGEDPLGAVIRIKDVTFRVIGVLERKGQNAWGQDQDDVILIPFTTAERRVLGAALLGSVDFLFVQHAARRGPDARRGADRGAAAPAPPHRAFRGRGLHRAEPRRHGARLRERQPRDVDLAAQRRLDLAPRGGHRDHEHPAGLGHGAHPRDRRPHGGGGEAPPHPAPVPGRGRDALAGGRPRRSRARRRVSVAVSTFAGWPT